MSIADSFGYDIEIESLNKKADINNQTIIHQMNTTITNSGDGNVINTGSENQIENNVTFYKGDIERLQKELFFKKIFNWFYSIYYFCFNIICVSRKYKEER